MSLQDNLKKLYGIQDRPILKSQQTTLENSVESLFEKGGKRAGIGEIREHGGMGVRK